MNETINFLSDHYDKIIMIAGMIYEIAVRLFPTNKNISLIDKAIKIFAYIIPNRSKEVTTIKKDGNVLPIYTKNHVIKMIVFFMLFSVSSFAQLNTNVKSLNSYNTDSATVKLNSIQLQTAYGKQVGSLYYNRQSKKWRVMQDSVWYNLVNTSTGGAISGLTSPRIPYALTPTSLGDDSGLVWDATNNAITIGNTRMYNIATNSLYIGNGSGNFTSTANQNTALGALTLSSNTNGGVNVALGYAALNANTTGNSNVAIGFGCLDTNLTGSSNTGVGINALTTVSSNDNNTGIGAGALTLATGASNTALGSGAGSNITTGANNMILGAGILAQSVNTDNQLSIQNIIFGLNNSGTATTVSTGFIGIGQPAPVYQLHITGNAPNKTLMLVEEDNGQDILDIKESAGLTTLTINTTGSTDINSSNGINITSSSGSDIIVTSAANLSLTSGTGLPISLFSDNNVTIQGPNFTFIDDSGTLQSTIKNLLTASGTLNFPSTAAGAISDLTLTVTGAAVGGTVFVGPPAAGPTVGGYLAWVSSANTVTVRYFNNGLVSAVDPASASFRVTVFNY